MHRDGRATEESSGQEDSTAVVMATAAGVAPRVRKGMMAFIDAAQTWGGPTLRLKARAQGGVRPAAKATTSWGRVRPTGARRGWGTACACVGHDTRLA
jgi:hypothetical protein